MKEEGEWKAEKNEGGERDLLRLHVFLKQAAGQNIQAKPRFVLICFLVVKENLKIKQTNKYKHVIIKDIFRDDVMVAACVSMMFLKR